MGPSLCVLAKKAIEKAGVEKRVIAVSRGSDKIGVEYMKENGVEFIPMDLLDFDKLRSLPAMVADKYKNSNIVVFSTGCVYPILSVSEILDENLKPDPIGDYSMSCLVRERAFRHAADRNGTKVFIYRLSYAIDLRYGVLYDLVDKILNETPISLSIPYFKYVWQGYANEVAIRALNHASAPANIMLGKTLRN